MHEKILICTSTFADADPAPLALLKSRRYEIVMNPYRRTLSEEEVVTLGTGCTGIISGSEPLNARVLAALPALRCISRVGVGLDNIDPAVAEQRGISIKNTPNTPTRAVAELTIGFMLDLLRGISAHDREVRNGTWKKKLGYQIHGRTVGIVGLGRIGRIVGELAAGLGARVTGYDIYPNRAWAEQHGVVLKDLPAILAESDIVTVHIPFSKENTALVSEKEIRMMKKGSFLLNLSRGGIVDEDALFRALEDRHLAGAAIDTFAREPYHGPLTMLDSVVLTPHMGSATHESRAAMEREAAENLIAGLDAARDTI